MYWSKYQLCLSQREILCNYKATINLKKYFLHHMKILIPQDQRIESFCYNSISMCMALNDVLDLVESTFWKKAKYNTQPYIMTL